MRHQRWLFCVLGCLIAAALFSSCEKNPSSNHKSKYLRLNFQDGDVVSIHPHRGVDLRALSLEKALFEGLTRRNAHGVSEPAAAENIEISPCGTVYTFTVRPSYWSNGEKVTAFHFEAAWKRALAPDSDCLRAEFFYPIKNAFLAKKGEVSLDAVGIVAIDADTLQITLEHPTPYFLDLTASPLYSPLFDVEEEPTVFNGPFCVEKWEREKNLSLARNPHYWDANKVKLEGIEIIMVKEPFTALALYEKGEIDWIGDPFSPIAYDAIPDLEASQKLKSQEVSRVYWISCNTEHFPLNNASFRKALSLAIDRNALVTHVLFGQTPFGSPLPSSLALVEEEKHFPQERIQVAKNYLEKALEDLDCTLESLPPIVLSYADIGGEKRLAESLQQAWEILLGIKVHLECFEWKTFCANFYRRNYQLGGCLRSALYYDPMYFLAFFKEKTQPINWPSWEDTNYRELLDVADHTLDIKERTKLLYRAEKILLDEMPVIPLYVHNFKYLTSERVKGVLISELGYVDFKEAYFSEELEESSAR